MASNRKRDSVKGIAGLVNIGNTCFMNSSIQCLSACLELSSYLSTGKYKDDIELDNTKKELWKLFLAYGKLILGMWRDNEAINPRTFKQVFGYFYKRFGGNSQQDAHECIIFILEGLHEALCYGIDVKIKRKSNKELTEGDLMDKKSIEQWALFFKDKYSVIVDLFYGQIHSVQMCVECKTQSHVYQPSMDLQLPIPKEPPRRGKDITIYDCMMEYIKQHDLQGENQYACEKCNKKVNGITVSKIWRPPKVLIVHLKRFNNNRKIEDLISVPLTGFDIVPYISEYKISPQNYNRIRNSPKNKYIYDLFAVCNHSGNLKGGHYTANTLNPNGRWYNFNDQNVMEIGPHQVITSNAYVLFFRNRKLSEFNIKTELVRH